MKRLLMALIASTLIASLGSARGADYNVEVREWVIEPCMHVMAALDVDITRQEHLDMGTNRDGLVLGLVASRFAATEDIASQIAKWQNTLIGKTAALSTRSC